MKRPPTLKARILGYLKDGERTDREVFEAMAPTPIKRTDAALVDLVLAGRVRTRDAGTKLRLA